MLDFVRRRWLRLFPAMLIASVVLFIFDLTVHEGPSAGRKLIDLVPGLTFLSPSLIHAVTNLKVQSMDDPFWSLYVEVVFYCAFGIAFFLGGWKIAVTAILGLFAVSVAARECFGLDDHTSVMWKISSALDWMGFTCFGWFASGALFYKCQGGSRPRLFWVAVCVAALSARTTEHVSLAAIEQSKLASFLALLTVITVFSTAVSSRLIQRLCSCRMIVFLGFVSYPLYLMHNSITIGIVASVSKRVGINLTPLIPLLAVIALSWLVAKYLEPRLRLWLSVWVLRRAYGSLRPS